MKYPEQKGLISIIVPIYNTKELYLRECLDSVLAQTFANWEAILVNDGSTDGTEKIIEEYIEKDSRFIAIHKQNEGTLLARKTGLENSRGEFIANLDHDDAYNPQFLEKMYAKITETNADFVWCKCQVTDKKSAYYMSDYEWNVDVSENIKAIIPGQEGANWILWNKLIKRNIYAKVKFPDVYLIAGEDPIQMFQIACHSKSAVFIPRNFYFHRLTGFTLATSPLSWLEAFFYVNEILKKLFNGIIPQNVKNIFYVWAKPTAYNYFLLGKKEREKFRSELEPLFPKLIKHEKKLNLRICLFLASKGIEFPFRLRETIRKKLYMKIFRNIIKGVVI
jgi:glycosyltransferase involved in cell wall biosynthesis